MSELDLSQYEKVPVQAPTEAVQLTSSQPPTNVLNLDDYERKPANISSNSTPAEQYNALADSNASKARAVLRGAVSGTMALSTFFQKAFAPVKAAVLNPIAKHFGYEVSTSADIQKDFDENYAGAKANPDVQAHPNYFSGGEMGANTYGTAPAYLAGGGVVKNAISGVVQGAMSTEPGQDSLFNEAGAKVGGALGAVGGLFSGAAQKAGAYTKQVNALADIGYNGPVFSTDVKASQGMWNSLKQGVVNYIAGNIPGIKDIPWVGVGADRKAQLDGVQSALGTMIEQLKNKYPNGNLNTFTAEIKEKRAEALRTINIAGNEVKDGIVSDGIKTLNVNDTIPTIKNLLDEPNYSSIDKSLKKNLTNVLQNGELTPNEYFGYKPDNGRFVPGLKQQLHAEQQRLAANTKSDPNAFNASNALGDIITTLKSNVDNNLTNPDTLEKLHNFNTVAAGIYHAWDPKTIPNVASAAMTLNETDKSLQTAFNKLSSISTKTTDPAVTSKYLNLTGEKTSQITKDQFLTNAFENSYEDGKFDISKLLDITAPRPGTQAELLVDPQVRTNLENLKWMSDQATKGLQSSTAGTATTAGAAGALGLYTHPVIATAIAAAPTVLGILTAHPPVYRALRALDNMEILGKSNLASYLVNNASKALTSAGVSYNTLPDGSLNFYKNDKTENK